MLHFSLHAKQNSIIRSRHTEINCHLKMLQELFQKYTQKQPPKVFFKKRCSQKFRKIHRKIPVSDTFFLITLQARPATLLKERLCQRCSPVNFTKFLRTASLQKTSEPLLLDNVQDAHRCFIFFLFPISFCRYFL